MSQEAVINSDVLHWARMRAGLEPEIASKGITSNPEKFLEWETGDARPTLAQARKLAERLHVPFGYLFLTELPDEQLPLPDLRTRDDRPLHDPSTDLIEQVNLTIIKQRWYREYRVTQGFDTIQLVSRFNLNDNIEQVASDIRLTLNLPEYQYRVTSWSAFLTEFVRAVEAINILVMRSGVVGNNSRRPLNPDEFQGFAIADPIAPLIFLNSRDYLVARIFTLAHELAHIWLGQSGVSLVDPAEQTMNNTDLENWCNKVAAETLVPSENFIREWREQNDIDTEVNRLSRRYRVSKIVILRRALDLGRITRNNFFELLEIARNEQPPPQQRSSGNQINNLIARNSRVFTEVILGAAFEGKVGYSDACRFLGVKVKTLHSLAGVLGVR